MSLSSQTLMEALRSVTDPVTGMPVVPALKESEITLDGQAAQVRIAPGYAMDAARKAAITARLEQAGRQAGAQTLTLQYKDGVVAHAVQAGLKPIESIKNIIAVASGKGGVGKSTTTANLAIALAQSGARVGVLDADIYGPSQPLIMGVSGKPTTKDGKTMDPLRAHGITVNSIGFLIDADAPAIWRGPMVTQALEQLLRQTNWPDVDYLIVDMPPGTGDVALTLAQKVPVVGAIIVTTPQDIALLDARKGLNMFKKMNIPILGVVENMAMHICSNCGHAEAIFGEDGGRKMAEELGVAWLGALPLARHIREQTDAGTPTVAADPDSEAAKLYRDVAQRVAMSVAALPKDMAGRFPSVVVENLKR